MAAAGRYIDAAAMILRLTPATYVAIYDDDNNNDPTNVNDAAVQADIDGAEGEVDSWIIAQYPMPLPATTAPTVDRLAKLAALDYACSLAWRRHPEYVRTFGENPRADGLWQMAEARMKRIQEAIQQLPDIVEQGVASPRNVGGVLLDDGPRTIIPDADGDCNGGDF
jgi:hypothetical protein